MTSRWSVCVVFLLPVLWPAAVSGQTKAAPNADDLVLVDCRLPPRQKRIGNRTYPMASPPVRTTALDCNIRGGEYTAYDRANYATSLKIWLAEAEKGNVEAAYYVGKLYEGGLGTEPDYKSAAIWYEKAAKAGHSASQFRLGALYEQGLGVTADSTKAFKLYRSATGLPDNVVMVDSGKYEALEEAANKLALREQQIEELQHQLDDAKKQLKRDENRELELQRQLDDERRKSESQKSEVARIGKLVQGGAQSLTPTSPKGTATALHAPAGVSLGRYYALVIGNGRYEHLPPVASAESDAKAMAALLRDKYGFEVTLLLNASRVEILKKLFDLGQNLAENDNLVVFYAGRGKRDLVKRRGWWLPADAAADNETRTNWLPNQDVSDRLGLIPARHILVLADASYVGDITRGAPQPEPQTMTAAQWGQYVETTKRKRARLALSSGADGPLPGAGQSSRFTATLIDVLQHEKGVFPASRLHREVVNALTANEPVTSAVPTFAPLQSALHDGVDFLFERKPGS